MAPFGSSRKHLDAEFAWLDRALSLMMQLFHQDDGEAGGQGWFLSRRQVESWLARGHDDGAGGLSGLREEVRLGRLELQLRRRMSAEAGTALRLVQAENRLNLSPIEGLALLVCLAAEAHPKYGKTYAYLQDDLTRKLPSMGLIAQLARECGVEGGPIRPSSSPLLKWRVVVCPDAETFVGPRIAQGMQLDQAVCAFLLEEEEATFRGPITEIHAGVLDQITALSSVSGRKLVIAFHGPGASDGRMVAECVAERFGLNLRHAKFHGTPRPDTLTRAMLEAVVQGSALYVAGLAGVADEPQAGILRAVQPLLAQGPAIIFLELDRLWFPQNLPDEVVVAAFYLDTPEFPQRLAHWKRSIASLDLAEEENREVASRYRLLFSEIDEVARSARVEAELRGGPEEPVQPRDIATACRARSRGTLGSLARIIRPKQSWKSLVLPADSIGQLHEICAHVRQRARVYHDWGFEARLSAGRGLYVMFFGPSGTGKTLAAEVVAGELGLELLRVDLSAVVSKYIGETEKNLQRVFEAADRSDAILFFDEADALFGKRSEIKDAHDRYANIEVNFLLQRLEEFEGVAILATNFVQNIDDAFTRRIHLTVDFPFPSENSRLAIWGSHLPELTPLGGDVNLAWLAETFEIAGGNIRNVVLNAAFLAADEAQPIRMDHFLQAARREYEKMGKPYRTEHLPVFAATRNGAMT